MGGGGADIPGKAEIPVVTRECRRNSRKTTWFPPLGKMRPLPATESQRTPPGSAPPLPLSLRLPSRSGDPREHNWDQTPTQSHRNLDPRSPGLSLETPSRARASSCQEVGTTWFFSSCGGILEL